jgi:MFS family permease
MRVVGVLCMAGLLSSSVQSTVFPIQQDLPEYLNSTREATAWVVTSSLLVAAVVTPISGRLGDMYGKRRLALTCLALTTLGALTCALAGSSLLAMIVGRLLQGTAVGVTTLGMGIMQEVLPPRRVMMGVSLMSSTMGVGAALGLPVSALITQYIDWHAAAAVTAAIGAISLFLVAAFVPADTSRAGGRLDIPGALGLIVGVSSLLLVMANGRFWGFTSPLTLSLVGGGVVVLALWSWWELRDQNPLVDLRVCARPSILAINATTMAIGFAMYLTNVAIPQIMSIPVETGVGMGYSILVASLMLVPHGAMMMVATPLAVRYGNRFGPKRLTVIGCIALALSYIPCVIGITSLWQPLANGFLMGIALALSFTAIPTLTMWLVEPSEVGAANGVNILMRNLGTTAAGAVTGAVLAATTISTPAGDTPTMGGFQTVFGVAMIAAVIAAGLAFFIPHIHGPKVHEPLAAEPVPHLPFTAREAPNAWRAISEGP